MNEEVVPLQNGLIPMIASYFVFKEGNWVGLGVATCRSQETKGLQLWVSCPISPCVCQSLGCYSGRMCGSRTIRRQIRQLQL